MKFEPLNHLESRGGSREGVAEVRPPPSLVIFCVAFCISEIAFSFRCKRSASVALATTIVQGRGLHERRQSTSIPVSHAYTTDKDEAWLINSSTLWQDFSRLTAVNCMRFDGCQLCQRVNCESATFSQTHCHGLLVYVVPRCIASLLGMFLSFNFVTV